MIAAAGSRLGACVFRLVGNHELMLMTGDLRYVHRDEIKATGGNERFARLFSETGPYGRQIREHFLPMAMLNGTLFVHAGYSPEFAMPIAELGGFMLQQLRRGLDTNHPVWGSEGPLWYRGLVFDDDRCTQVDQILTATNARRIVVGHTPQQRGISAICNGSLILADHGMSRWIYGMTAGVVEIIHDQVHAVYPQGRQRLT
eukprot:gnl/TRDRNA2_/TRDRNA2_139637_c1_seq1.p1 gnl/TRDRNA2_/TRDRNA2_139637_c1~~gnl/TRDRNA2_/TRDRNA2_139637_c1_seq1.p1  ORF type:complete len:229 (-),score=14.10 gnl/TRDRNA2_/TRDRNA2_139637_c1_seq1:181-783(-)